MLSISNVSKYYRDFPAVDQISLEIGPGEIFFLLGRSGCGKTTTLKMINRLIEHDEGTITFQGKNVMDYDPVLLRRRIGYVIQSIGLFPHMNIGKNIAIVPRLLAWSPERIREAVKKVLEIVKLPPAVLSRYPGELSGGQKQRIGVARALIADPDLLLMDEPFGALDPITREELQLEFKNLFRELKKSIVFVTHDIFEAFILGTRIALMENGRVIQVDTPYDLLTRPANDYVAGFTKQHKASLLDLVNN